eukprot:gene2507-biopygen1375
MDELSKKKRVRASHRGCVTKIANDVRNLIDGGNADKQVLKAYKKEMESKLKTLERINEEVMELLCEEEDGLESCMTEAEDASMFTTRGNLATPRLQTAISQNT